MTNVNQGLMRINFNCKDVVDSSANIAKIKLVDKNNVEYPAVLAGHVVVTGETSYADISFAGSPAEGPATLKIQDVEDSSRNKATLKSYDLTLGNGPKVDSALFATTSSDTATPSVAGDSIVRINYTGNLDTTTLAGNVKLLNGTTEVAATVDASKTGYLRVLPAAPLTAGTQYTVVVSKNLKDVDGNLLQQNALAAPADFSVKLTTVSSNTAKLVSSVVDESARTVTLTFDKTISTVDDDVSLVNYADVDHPVVIDNDSANAAIPAANKQISIDGKTVVLTVYGQLLKNIDYQGSIEVNTDASASFSVLTTKKWVLDSPPAKPEVAAGTLTPNASGVFTLTFTEDVKVDDVKAAFKVYNATDAENVTMFGSSIVPQSATPVDSVDYDSTYTISIPGYNAAKSYVVSLAKASFTDVAGFKNATAWDQTLAAAVRSIAAPTVTLMGNMADGYVNNAEKGNNHTVRVPLAADVVVTDVVALYLDGNIYGASKTVAANDIAAHYVEFTITAADVEANATHNYTAQIFNSTAAISSPVSAQATVVTDITAPTGTTFTVVNPTTATVVFDKTLDATKFAAGTDGFTVGGTGSPTVTNAVLEADGVTVTLTVSTPV